MRNSVRLSLAARAASLVGIVFVLAFALVGWFSLRVFEREHEAQASQHQFAMMKALAENLDQKLSVTQDVLQGASRLVTPTMLSDPDAAERFLESRTFLRKSFDQGISLHAASGALIAKSGEQVDDASLSTSPMAALAAATLQDGLPRMGPVAGGGASPAILMTMPVKTATGRLAGVLVGRLSLLRSDLAGELATMKIGRSGYLYMVTADGTMLMHPDRTRQLKLAAPAGKNLGLDRALNEGFEGTVDNVNSKGVRALTTFVRLPAMGWILVGTYPLEELRAPLHRSLQWGLMGMAVAVSLLAALVIALLRHWLLPIRELADRMRMVGQGGGQPFNGVASGELAQIGAAYNHMLEDLAVSERERQVQAQRVLDLNAALEVRVAERTEELAQANRQLGHSLAEITRMQDERVRSEKALALGRVVAGLAHELNTPLGNALTVSSALADRQRDFGESSRAGTLRRRALEDFLVFADQSTDVIQRNLVRLGAVVQSMRELAEGQGQLTVERFDLQAFVEDWASRHVALAGSSGIDLQVDAGPGRWVEAPVQALERVLDQLWRNAVQHAFVGDDPGATKAKVRLRLTEAEHSEGVCLEFADNGKGIPVDQRRDVFDPFSKGSMGRDGAGLGLSIVHNLVTAVLGGTITLVDSDDPGTRWLVCLPTVAVG